MSIATLTLNPALDVTFTVGDLMYEETNRAKSVRRDPGGKAINVSRVLKRLGGETTALAFIGGHNGHAIYDLLHEDKIKVEFVRTRNETRMNAAIMIEGSSKIIKINEKGPEVSQIELGRMEELVMNMAESFEYLVMSGSLPPGVPDDYYSKLIASLSALKIKCILDSSRDSLKYGIESLPYMVKPNRYEVETLLGKSVKTIEEVINAAKDLHNKGIEIAVISCADEGSIAVSDEGVFRCIPPKVDVQSTIGAGDSLVAGILWKLSNGESLGKALQFGVAAGTATVLTPGTGLCNIEDIDRILKEVIIEER